MILPHTNEGSHRFTSLWVHQLQNMVDLNYERPSLPFSLILAQLRAVIRFAQWAILIDDHCEQGDPVLVKQRIDGAINTFLNPDEFTGPFADETARRYVLSQTRSDDLPN